MSITAHIHTIPHAEQRYSTCGDWEHVSLGMDDRLAQSFRVSVSDLGNWRMEFLVAVHELIEAALCRHRGITDEQVTEFDKAFEERNPRAAVEAGYIADEPGDAPDAPYRDAHCFATGIERLLAAELGVVWRDYEYRILAL